MESQDTGAVATHTVNVRLIVQSAFRMQRQDPGSSRLELGRVDPGERSAVQELALGLVNNVGAGVQLLQELTAPLSNDHGDLLPLDALEYRITSGQGEGGWRPMASGTEVLATDPRGELTELRAAYAAVVPAQQPAGTYQGTLRLSASSAGVSAAEETAVELAVTVNELFTMSVLPVDGAGSTLEFSPERGDEGPVERRVRVEIRSNLRRPYQVSAGLDHPLVLPSGETLPREVLTWSMQEAARGTMLVSGGAPVAVGYEPVYQSDAQGSPDAFILTYRLAVPPETRGGFYSGQLRFSITMF